MKNREILLHTDTMLKAMPSARRQGVRYALWVAAISLITQVVDLVVTQQMDATGGLAGIGTRSVLASVQSVVGIATMLVLPFLEWGHYAVALRTTQMIPSERSTLLQGLMRFGPLLRLNILRILLGLMLMLAASNIASVIYGFLPGSVETLQSLQNALLEAGTAVDSEFYLEITKQLWPLYLISGILMIAVCIPIFYRLRLAEWQIMDGEGRALMAMMNSYRAMRGNCWQLARLDLWQWEYYLLIGISVVVAYGDVLLGIEAQWGYWVFYLLSLIMQTGVTALFVPRVHTAYATFYLDKIQTMMEVIPEMEC